MTLHPPRLTATDLQRRLDTRTKPQGSLGRLETLAIRIGLALQSVTPSFSAPHILVFAGDHGLAAEGVSAYPSEVTAQMVGNYLAGGAAINVLARQFGLRLTVVDAGVAHPIPMTIPMAIATAPGLLSFAQGPGTRNALHEPAMSAAQCAAAVAAGRSVAAEALTAGSNALLLGEMGIGNTAASALLLHATLLWPLEHCVGRGTGLDDSGLARKLAILKRTAGRCSVPQPLPMPPLDALREFGGFELAMLVGAIIESAQHDCIVVIDGFAVSVAALLASRLDASALAHCVFSHCSAEHAHRALLQYLEVEPLLDLELRLGEASGAALAWPLIEAAARLLSEMASFESAQVSNQMSTKSPVTPP